MATTRQRANCIQVLRVPTYPELLVPGAQLNHDYSPLDIRTTILGRSITTVSRLPTTRPNTTIHYLVYTRHSILMPTGQLKQIGWTNLTIAFFNQEMIDAILGICEFGARIGY